jgi:UDP-N-acetylmuramoylalanine--D-glutamate ligase
MEAVNEALTLAAPGDAVLFSPMCSSYDMFKDYKERGEKFRRLVEAL